MAKPRQASPRRYFYTSALAEIRGWILGPLRRDHGWRAGKEWDPRRKRYVWPREQTYTPSPPPDAPPEERHHYGLDEVAAIVAARRGDGGG